VSTKRKQIAQQPLLLLTRRQPLENQQRILEHSCQELTMSAAVAAAADLLLLLHLLPCLRFTAHRAISTSTAWRSSSSMSKAVRTA